MMRSTYIVVCSLLLAIACRGDVDQAAVSKAFDSLIVALDRGDLDMLWGLSDPETRGRFDDLARRIMETETLIDAHLPEDQREEARSAIGRRLVGPAGDGRSLFAAVIDPGKLAAPEDPNARKVARIEIAADQARVELASGDVMPFTRAPDGTWRTRLFLKGLDDLPGIVTLHDNLATIRHNVRVLTGEAPPAAPSPAPQAP